MAQLILITQYPERYTGVSTDLGDGRYRVDLNESQYTVDWEQYLEEKFGAPADGPDETLESLEFINLSWENNYGSPIFFPPFDEQWESLATVVFEGSLPLEGEIFVPTVETLYLNDITGETSGGIFDGSWDNLREVHIRLSGDLSISQGLNSTPSLETIYIDGNLPNTLTLTDCFQGCGTLTNIVRSVNNPAMLDITNSFYGETAGLTSVNLYNMTVHGTAFSFGNLEQVTVGAGFNMAGDALAVCCGSSALTSIYVSDNQNYNDNNHNNCLIETATNKLVLGCVNSVLPNTVTSIGSHAFEGSAITSFVVPDSVTYISENAFRGCESLESITLHDNITYIGDSAFAYCHNLHWEVDLPANLTYIGSAAFYEDDLYGDIVIPEGITELPNSIFYGSGDWSNSTITIGRNVTSIANQTFDATCANIVIDRKNAYYSDGRDAKGQNCIIDKGSGTVILGSTNAIIPNNVTSIGQEAFKNSKITSVTIPDSVTGLGDSVFHGCTEIQNLKISKNITNIPDYTFASCSKLKKVIIPGKVTEIGYRAFNASVLLDDVVSKNEEPPVIKENTFRDISTNAELSVPEESVDTYSANTNWSRSFRTIKAIPPTVYYTVTTSASNGGSITPTTTVEAGETVEIYMTPNEDYEIKQVLVDGLDVGTIDNYIFQNLDADHTVHVDFKKIGPEPPTPTKTGFNLSGMLDVDYSTQIWRRIN